LSQGETYLVFIVVSLLISKIRSSLSPDQCISLFYSKGTNLNFEVVSEAVSHIRMNKAMAPDWKKRIDEDFEKRGKKQPEN